MSTRILAGGIAESVSRVTPRTRVRAHRIRVTAVASLFGWGVLIGGVLFALRALS